MSVKPTPQETIAEFPGDHLVENPDVISSTAFTVDGPPEEVYGYITQMGMRKSHGENRGGWPLPAWLETFIPKERRALRQVDPSLALQAGDDIGDWFSGRTRVEAKVVEAEAPRTLVFQSKRGNIDISWAILADEQEDGTTRVQTRLRLGSVKHKKAVEAVGGVIDRALVAGLQKGINERIAGKPEPSEKGYKALQLGAVAGALAVAYTAGRKSRNKKVSSARSLQ